MAGEIALDTSVVVAHFRKDESVTERMRLADLLFVPLTVVGELYYGAFRASQPQKALERLRQFLSASVVLHPGERTALRYGEIKKHLAGEGTPVPDNDIWIAATAIEHALPLAARDEHYVGIPDLDMRSW